MLFAMAIAATGVRADERDSVSFAVDLEPILTRHCTKCHGSETRKAELDLSSLESLSKGGESGTVVVAGKLQESLLWEKLESGEMPPDQEPRLSAAEKLLVRRWIESGAQAGGESPAERELTQHDVLPILTLRCAACHGRQRREAGLDVRSRAALLKGGKSGPAIVPGDPGASLLVQKIAAGAMPPKTQLAAVSVKPVESHELNRIRDWIARGAVERPIAEDVANGEPDPLVSDEDRQFWAFQPPRTVVPPDLRSSSPPHPVDAFILQKLRERDLTLNPPASRTVLIRRVYLDLIGLPPAPDRVQAFLADPDPLAYERLVDELLASPRYGERWGQYWLDAAGYSDSEGVQDSDVVRAEAYRYRDYVIQSWNQDKSYDRFLREQIAGDELADYEHAPTITGELYDQLVATGFLRMSPDGTFAGITAFVPDRLEVIDDELRILASSVMGLTIGCARCHSHKFDPIPQRDYYRLAAIFKGALDEHDWLKPTRQSGPPGVADRFLTQVPSEERAAWQSHESALTSQIDAIKAQLAATAEAEAKKPLESRLKELEGKRRPEPLVRALWDRGQPSPTYVLQRGNYLTPTRLVGPGVPSVLTDGRTPFTPRPPWPGANQSGRRLEFARWLTQPNHPLTARVLVNRIWKHHFGVGIVATLDNFGRAGAAPSHPDLLDWLAVEFVRGGWSIKQLQRTLVTSATYQQDSRVTSEHLARDPDNLGLSRFPLRRLDAEAFRDSQLAIAGRLDLRQFGSADAVTARPDGLVTVAAPQGTQRRSIYLLQRRSQPVTLLADFDRPAMNPNCVARMESTVAPQALHLMNSALIHELSDAFRDRVISDAGPDQTSQIERIHWLALGRAISDEELVSARQSLEALTARWLAQIDPDGTGGEALKSEASRKALANYCHAILNSASTIFID